MVTLGIIGAENSHSHCIAELCNVNPMVEMRVTHLWGETREAAEKSAGLGQIPNIVADWREMLGQVDGVMIDHRHGRDHVEPAQFFIENKVPVFIDKPMAANLADAKALLDLAEKNATPVISFGLLPLQKVFREAVAQQKGEAILAVNTSGPAEIDSPYGGVAYYGFHQVDAMVEILGTEAVAASLHRNGGNGVATVLFSNGRIATMNCLASGGQFHWRICTDKEVVVIPHQYDEVIYLESVKAIHRFLAFGETPWSRARMLAPIAILDALQKSLVSGRLEEVAYCANEK